MVTIRLLWGHVLPKRGNAVGRRCACSFCASLKRYRLSPYVIQTILGAVSVAGTVPSLSLIETWGRRRVRIHPSPRTFNP